MIQSGRDDFERRWMETALQNLQSSKQEKNEISDKAFHEAAALTQDWTEQVKMQKITMKNAPYYDYEWHKYNRKAKFPV
jgi:hypothetical protein